MSDTPLKQRITGKRLDASKIVTRMIPVENIEDHPDNPNTHSDEQIGQLAESHGEFGQYKSILVWARPGGKYVRVAGHGYSAGAMLQGESVLRCEVLHQDTPASTVSAIMSADNLHGRNSELDQALLAGLLQEQADAGFSLESLGSSEEALNALLESLDGALEDDEYSEDGSEDDIPEDVETRCKLGDVWKLGRHIIACINSCDVNVVKRLIGNKQINYVFSDPPYGIDIVATNGYVGGGEAYDIPFGGVKNRKQGLGTVGGSKPFGSKDAQGKYASSKVIKAAKYSPIVGDDSTDTAVASSALCLELFPNAVQVWWGANYYANALPPSSCWIVWDKETNGNFADAELAWCSDDSAVRIFKHMWNGMLKDSEHGQKRVHPSQKPVKLVEWCFEKYGQEGDIIFDPFLGSGISVIAAENLGRTVIGCELSPEYCSIVIARWEQHTGQQAQLLDRIEDTAHV